MSTDPLLGKQFGSYELKELLGRGGMAAVYRGYQAAIDRSVAVKVLPAELLADPHFSVRFSNEARTLAKLSHPHILPLYDFGEANGMPYIVMPLMSNGTLADRLKSGPLTLAETVRVITAVAQGLDFANKQGILHRDIKPNNILFDQHDNPYLADFGIAKAMESSTGLTGTGIIGTPDYMSPEQARGDPLDHRSDLYSLGVVTYQCLTGNQLFRATTPMGVIFKHVSEAPLSLRAIRADIPEAVDKTVLKALAKGPDERYTSASEFARALARASAEALATPPAEGTAVHDEPPTQLHQPPGTGSGWAAATGASAAAATGSAFTLPPESVSGAAPARSGGESAPAGGEISYIGASEPAPPGAGGFSLPADMGVPAGPGAAPAAGNRNLLLIGGGIAALLVVCCLGALAVWYAFFREEGGGPAVNPTPATPALFTENFENGEGPWNTFDDGEVSRQLEDGEYVFRSSKTGWFTWDNPDESFEAVRVEVTARNTGADDTSFGLMCHYQDGENYYYAGVGSDGYYAIIRTQADEDYFLTDASNQQWKTSDVIPLNAESYRVSLVCANGDLALYVDDQLIAQVQDDTFTGGDVGLFLLTFEKPDGEVRFDDFVVSAP